MFKPVSLPLAAITLGAALTALLGAARSASASNYDEGQWITSFTAGTGLSTSGTMMEGARGSLADLGTLDPRNAAVAGAAATTSLNRLSFRDAYDAGPSLGLEVGYLMNSGLEPFVRLDHSQLGGRRTRIGTLTSEALASPEGVTGDFRDMNSWALDVGSRYFFPSTGPWRPFVTGYVGLERSDALHARLSVAGVDPEIGSETLLPRENRFNAGVEAGIGYQVSDQATLSLSAGADYAEPREFRSAAFEPLGLEPVRITDQRWTVPINLGLSYHF